MPEADPVRPSPEHAVRTVRMTLDIEVSVEEDDVPHGAIAQALDTLANGDTSFARGLFNAGRDWSFPATVTPDSDDRTGYATRVRIVASKA